MVVDIVVLVDEVPVVIDVSVVVIVPEVSVIMVSVDIVIDVSVDIVADVSVEAAVSVMLMFSSFLHPKANSPRATTIRITRLFFIFSSLEFFS